MPEIEDSSLDFSGGHVVNRNLVFILGRPRALAEEDYDFTRVSVLNDGQWGCFDVETTVRSVCHLGTPPEGVYCLAIDGRAIVRKPSGRPAGEERIADAGTGKGKLGYVNVIREIGGTLYACGVAGQVYRRDPGKGWAHHDEGVLDPGKGIRALGLYCIDGTSESDIYTVGQRGMIWHHDGQRWTRIDPPTTVDLNWVRCAAPDEAYLCGNRGTFFRGNRAGWEDFSVRGMDGDFWCVEVFGDRAYLAADDGLHVFDGKSVKPLETGLDPAPDAYRLHANDGVLWSFGEKTLAFYDGRKWTLVEDPDNA